MYLLPFLFNKVILDTFLCHGLEVIGIILLSSRVPYIGGKTLRKSSIFFKISKSTERFC